MYLIYNASVVLQIGYDFIEAIVAFIIAEEQQHGPAALLTGWKEFDNSRGQIQNSGKGAILIFMPGAMEISRLARKLAGLIEMQVCAISFTKMFTCSCTMTIAYFVISTPSLWWSGSKGSLLSHLIFRCLVLDFDSDE